MLGLDIGIASIGWGLIELTEEVEDNDENRKHEKTGQYLDKKAIPTGYKILDAGVRVWAKPQDRMGKSLALARGEARRIRRTLRRRVHRMEELVKELKNAKLLAQDFDTQNKEDWNKSFFKTTPNNDVWKLRKEALERKLTDQELARVIYHIIKHRGFYFTSKAELGDDSETASENAKVKFGMLKTEKLLKESGGEYDTIGQAFYTEYKVKGNESVRNGKDDYTKSIKRELLEEELRKIFKFQREEKDNQKVTEELEIKLIGKKDTDKKEGLLYKQKGVDPEQIINMINKDEFEKDELVAPKKSFSYEKFILLQKVNNLKINKIGLNQDQREIILQELFSKKTAKLTFADIRKLLKLDDKELFNFLTYTLTNPEHLKSLTVKKEDFNKKEIEIIDGETGEVKVIDIIKAEDVKSYIEKKQAEFKEKNKEIKSLKFDYNVLRRMLKEQISEKDLFSVLNYEDSEEKIGTKKYLEQFEKETFYEAKGHKELMNRIIKVNENYWEQIKENKEILNKIAVALCYFKEDEFRLNGYKSFEGLNSIASMPKEVKEELLKSNFDGVGRHCFTVLYKITPIMAQGEEYTKAMEKVGYDIYKEDKTEPEEEYLKYVWGVQCKNPVVDRTYSQVRKLINAIQKQYKDIVIDQINIETTRDLKHGKKQLARIQHNINENKKENEKAKELGKDWGIKPDKAKMLHRQQWKCVYCGTGLRGINIDTGTEVDHIYPLSQSFDNSQNNKVLVCLKCNQQKGQRTPYEWKISQGEEKWNEFVGIVKSLSTTLPYGMTQRLKNTTFHTEVQKDSAKFFNRDLVDTAYNAKFIVKYLRDNFYFLKSQRREDIKNNIQVRQGKTTAIIRDAWNIEKIREENDLHHALDALVLAFATQGMVQLISTNVAQKYDSFQGNNFDKNKKKAFYPYKGCSEKDFEKFKLELQDKLKNIFVSKMPRRKVTKDLHEETVFSKTKMKKGVNNPFLTKKESEKGEENKKNGFEIRKGIAKLGTMVRGDFFKEKETGNIHLIPLYTHHFTYKAGEVERMLPTKTPNGVDMEAVFEEDKIVKGKKGQKDQEFKKGDKKFEFMFSLYKDELVKYGKNEENADFYYVAYIRANGKCIALKNIDNSAIYTKHDENGKIIAEEKEYEFGLKTAFLEKYQVDMLGNFTKVKQETRVGNIRKKSKPKNKK